MPPFNINFVISDQSFSANFEKVYTTRIEFNVFDVEPSELSKKFNLNFWTDVEDPYLHWLYETRTDTEIEEERNFKNAIAAAIKERCAIENISLFE